MSKLLKFLKSKLELPMDRALRAPRPPKPSFQKQIPSGHINTGLGHRFDALVTADSLAFHRLGPPYDKRFENRTLLDIYESTKRRKGFADGRSFLQSIVAYGKDPLESAKVASFLDAIGQIDIEGYEEVTPEKAPAKGARTRRKGLSCAA